MTYLNENYYGGDSGKYQDDYTRLYDELVPTSGGCKTLGGEVVRAGTRLYYDYYNNGFLNNTSGARNFLEHYLVPTAKKSVQPEIVDCLNAIKHAVNTGGYTDLTEDECRKLETLVDHCILFARDNPQGKIAGTFDLFDFQDPDEYFHDEEDDYEATDW